MHSRNLTFIVADNANAAYMEHQNADMCVSLFFSFFFFSFSFFVFFCFIVCRHEFPSEQKFRCQSNINRDAFDKRVAQSLLLFTKQWPPFEKFQVICSFIG